MRSIVALVVLLSCAPLGAHDFWIEPSTFRPARGALLPVGLRVGKDFMGDPVARSAARIEEFVVRDAAGVHSVPGLENRDPAGFVRLAGETDAVIGYRSKGELLDLPSGKFEQFLREEGLERLAVASPAAQPHHERFYRYAKAFIGAAPPSASRPLGYRLEIVPDGESRWRVLFEGKPLAGALVTAVFRDDPAIRARVRSDARGRVEWTPGRGVWLLKTVHLVRGADATWESLWASLTFER